MTQLNPLQQSNAKILLRKIVSEWVMSEFYPIEHNEIDYIKWLIDSGYDRVEGLSLELCNDYKTTDSPTSRKTDSYEMVIMKNFK